MYILNIACKGGIKIKFLTFFIFFSSMVFSQNNVLSIQETINYINDLLETSEIYPYSANLKLENGILSYDTYYCSDDSSSLLGIKKYNLTDSVAAFLGKCGDTLDNFKINYGINLKELFRNNYPDSKYIIKGNENIMIIGPKDLNHIKLLGEFKRIDICCKYSYRFQRYFDSVNSIHCFEFALINYRNSEYNTLKLKNAFDYLIEKLEKHPELWEQNKLDQDPFAPHNYIKDHSKY